jgi:hypothetical protein
VQQWFFNAQARLEKFSNIFWLHEFEIFHFFSSDVSVFSIFGLTSALKSILDEKISLNTSACRLINQQK